MSLDVGYHMFNWIVGRAYISWPAAAPVTINRFLVSMSLVVGSHMYNWLLMSSAAEMLYTAPGGVWVGGGVVGGWWWVGVGVLVQEKKKKKEKKKGGRGGGVDVCMV